jgi:hypothetical protein
MGVLGVKSHEIQILALQLHEDVFDLGRNHQRRLSQSGQCVSMALYHAQLAWDKRIQASIVMDIQTPKTMGHWQVILFVLWMTFESRVRDDCKLEKQAIPSVRDKSIWGFRTPFKNSGRQMGQDGQERGPASTCVWKKTGEW